MRVGRRKRKRVPFFVYSFLSMLGTNKKKQSAFLATSRVWLRCGCVAVAGQRVTTYSTAFGCPTTTTCVKKEKCVE